MRLGILVILHPAFSNSCAQDWLTLFSGPSLSKGFYNGWQSTKLPKGKLLRWTGARKLCSIFWVPLWKFPSARPAQLSASVDVSDDSSLLILWKLSFSHLSVSWQKGPFSALLFLWNFQSWEVDLFIATMPTRAICFHHRFHMLKLSTIKCFNSKRKFLVNSVLAGNLVLSLLQLCGQVYQQSYISRGVTCLELDIRLTLWWPHFYDVGWQKD